MKSVLYAAVAAAFLSFVQAHGSVEYIIMDGVTYKGPISLDVSPPPLSNSPIRQISTMDPIRDPNSENMRCGQNAATTADAIATVTAGSDITVHYRAGQDGSNWPHKHGPWQVYMYKCPDNVTADKCEPPAGGDKAWFKIAALGFKTNRNEDGWYHEEFFNNRDVSATIPKGIQDGDYLLRLEIMALHIAGDTGGAEFYPSCTQVRVSGGTSKRSAEAAGAELAAFPGAYDPEHPGVHVNVFDSNMNKDTYPMPGPALFAGDTETSAPEPPSTSTDPDPAPEPTATTTPGKSCKNGKKKKRAQKAKRAHHKRNAHRRDGL
ncbi:hypothetical protein EXIGLDRAFT_734391 [Exidia glandulosa HHB12029]|uniref:lytic cellulose monooxygenase (C4-dehydrogenating) n=1 Tax=Exidia glandulosa HHB12029 TaxID=1314781 RepID=A0A165K7B8_EXIGL|nr:hypothetical protein EXIGLDRAFT_734391 [Exidia glandulosa HHB12029]